MNKDLEIYAMSSELTCPYCHSSKVNIVDSYETRDVVVIKCLTCGRESPLDTEHEQIDTGRATKVNSPWQ